MGVKVGSALVELVLFESVWGFFRATYICTRSYPNPQITPNHPKSKERGAFDQPKPQYAKETKEIYRRVKEVYSQQRVDQLDPR